MKKILGALQDLPAKQHSQSRPIPQIMAELAVLVSWQILNDSQDFFFHSFYMASYRKWNVKNGFAYVLHFFSLISDGLASVNDSLFDILNLARNILTNNTSYATLWHLLSLFQMKTTSPSKYLQFDQMLSKVAGMVLSSSVALGNSRNQPLISDEFLKFCSFTSIPTNPILHE